MSVPDYYTDARVARLLRRAVKAFFDTSTRAEQAHLAHLASGKDPKNHISWPRGRSPIPSPGELASAVARMGAQGGDMLRARQAYATQARLEGLTRLPAYLSMRIAASMNASLGPARGRLP